MMTPERAGCGLSAWWVSGRVAPTLLTSWEWHGVGGGACQTSLPVPRPRPSGSPGAAQGSGVCPTEPAAVPTSASRGRAARTRRHPANPSRETTSAAPPTDPAFLPCPQRPRTHSAPPRGRCCSRRGSLKKKASSHPETACWGTASRAPSPTGSVSVLLLSRRLTGPSPEQSGRPLAPRPWPVQGRRLRRHPDRWLPAWTLDAERPRRTRSS